MTKIWQKTKKLVRWCKSKMQSNISIIIRLHYSKNQQYSDFHMTILSEIHNVLKIKSLLHCANIKSRFFGSFVLPFVLHNGFWLWFESLEVHKRQFALITSSLVPHLPIFSMHLLTIPAFANINWKVLMWAINQVKSSSHLLLFGTTFGIVFQSIKCSD